MRFESTADWQVGRNAIILMSRKYANSLPGLGSPWRYRIHSHTDIPDRPVAVLSSEMPSESEKCTAGTQGHSRGVGRAAQAKLALPEHQQHFW